MNTNVQKCFNHHQEYLQSLQVHTPIKHHFVIKNFQGFKLNIQFTNWILNHLSLSLLFILLGFQKYNYLKSCAICFFFMVCSNVAACNKIEEK